MKIEVFRYYGDDAVTKSRIAVTLDGHAEPDMTCEGREPGHVHYTTDSPMPGWTTSCLPCGRLVVRLRPTVYSPMTLAVGMSVHSLRQLVAWHPRRQVVCGCLLVGWGDLAVEPALRSLQGQQEAFARLEELTRQAYYRGESFEMTVWPLKTAPQPTDCEKMCQ